MSNRALVRCGLQCDEAKFWLQMARSAPVTSEVSALSPSVHEAPNSEHSVRSHPPIWFSIAATECAMLNSNGKFQDKYVPFWAFLRDPRSSILPSTLAWHCWWVLL